MPLFTNHATMNIDARHVRCPELGCDRYLPAPKKCLNGQNKDRYYVSVSVLQRVAWPQDQALGPGRHPDCCHNVPDPSCKLAAASSSGLPKPSSALPHAGSQNSAHCLPHLWPPRQCALYDKPLQGRLSRTLDPAPSVPRPPKKARPRRSLDVLVAGLEDARAVLNTPQRLADLAQNHLSQQQEQAARLAALTPLPPSPTRSQEDRDRNMAIRLALGNSPPPPTSSRQTRRITLSHWLSSGPGCTTVFQDQPGWETRWPRIRLNDLVPFLVSSMHPRPDPYYDHWNFSLGVWVAIPLAYEFTVLTDEPILIRHSGTFAADQAEMVAAFSHLVKRVISPAPASARRKRSPSPSVQRARKHIKVEHEVSDDEIEVSAVRKVIKLEPHTPTAYRRLPPAVAPPFASLGASTSRLPALSPSLVASSSRLRLSSPLFDSRFASSSPFPSPPSLLYSTHSSTASSSSLASPGSSSVFPISFVDKD
ncbi:hypothetical protein DFH08DRAFT_962042 [Mycena albidolilacea]|uniref:Uncharacterized protein n=1 Tax=Mycena albidolilacea TaxID=1033008 RepID=A0AAD7EQ19_9AGAR|nr:hypothetical protein DFH08DRAFT_962042 [Mycena albidolilacea]